MTSIDMTHAQGGAAATGVTETVGRGAWTTVELSPKVIDQAVRHGRRLRSQAFAAVVRAMGQWFFATGRTALGRRATNKLGCGECGDMMRA